MPTRSPLKPTQGAFALIIAVCALACPKIAAQLNVLESTVVDPAALNFAAAAANFSQNVNGRTYQRHPMSTLNGYQYTTYYDSNRNVCLGRRQLPSGSWEVIRFTDYAITSSDSHNVVALGICAADGTIHLAFDHHSDPWNYRVSDLGVATNPGSVVWSSSLFNPVTNALGAAGTSSNVTYPSFFNAPNGNLMLYYRFQGSGSGDGMIHEYDGTTHDWTTGMGKFIARTGSYTGAVSTNSTSRNPYINGIGYAGNRLHASWGWRESAAGSSNNHDLNYAYSDDDGRTWNNSAGTKIGTTNSSFITINSPGLLVASIPQNIGLSNQYTHYAYPDGSCHVIVAHNESGTSNKRYHHYWRDAAGTWSSEVLPFSASRPKLVGDDDGKLFLAYVSGGRGRIARGVPNGSMSAWTWSVIHTQSDTTEGGEGHIDHSRWEAERILSFYGQETTNADGDATPLHVHDYQVSAKAILPTPLHQSTGVSETASLQWTPGIGASTHRIYLGTDPGGVAAATTASPEYFGEQAATIFTPAAALTPGTTYYWRVDEVDSGSNVHAGLLWSFDVVGNAPPTIVGLSDRIAPLGDPIADVSFTIDDDFTDPNALILTVDSSNPTLLPTSDLIVTGSGMNRALQVLPVAGQTGSSLVTVGVDDGTHLVEDTFTVTVTPPVHSPEVIAGWDVWNSPTAPTASVVATGVTGTAATTTAGLSWNISDERGASSDGDWGTDPGPPAADTTVGTANNQNLTLPNGTIAGTIALTLTNTGAVDVTLDSFHFDAYAFRPNAPRAYQLSIVSGDLTNGIIYTSADDEITHVGGANSNTAHDDIDHSLAGLADNVLGSGESVSFLLAFSSGTGSGGGHHLFIDNIAVTGVRSYTAIESWRASHFGTPGNSGDGADDADPNSDGEENFLEFVTGQDPAANMTAGTTLAYTDPALEFSYPRSVAALTDGVVFTVEWSDTLRAGSWSNAGVTEVIDSDDGSIQSVIATVPVGSAGSRFVRLKAIQP